MKRIQVTFVALFVAGVTAGFFGCGAVDQAFDCQDVCSRYQGCFNKDYDVGACRDRCRNKVSRDKADACQSCINDKSCTSATFTCATDCAGIVP